ncbi:MAG: hypothetical protein H7837_10545 [Magnetococcus sp. MYC-9]
MEQDAALEALIAERVTVRLRERVAESVHAWMPELVAGLLRQELERLQERPPAATPPATAMAEPPAGFEQLVQQAFLPEIHAIARRLVQEQVACQLPEVAERLTLEELAKL